MALITQSPRPSCDASNRHMADQKRDDRVQSHLFTAGRQADLDGDVRGKEKQETRAGSDCESHGIIHLIDSK